MTVTFLGRVSGERANVDSRFTRYTSRYKVKVTDPTTEGPAQVVSITGLPGIGDPYYDGTYVDIQAWCRQLTPEQDQQDPKLWIVTAEYSSEFDNPLLRSPKWKWTNITYEEAADRDSEGRPYVNSAGERFDPPRMVRRKILQLEYQRNEPSYDPLVSMDYEDALNDDTFLGAPEGLAKVEAIEGDHVDENVGGVQFSYYSVRRVFHFKRGGWDEKILDQGFYQIVLSGGTYFREAIVDDKLKQPVTSPQLLDGAGAKLPPPQPPTIVAPAGSMGTLGGVNITGGTPTILDAGAVVAAPDGLQAESPGVASEMLEGWTVSPAGAIQLSAGMAYTDLDPSSTAPSGGTSIKWNAIPGVFLTFKPFKRKDFSIFNIVFY